MSPLDIIEQNIRESDGKSRYARFDSTIVSYVAIGSRILLFDEISWKSGQFAFTHRAFDQRNLYDEWSKKGPKALRFLKTAGYLPDVKLSDL